VKEDEIGGACSMFGCGKIFQSEYLKGRGHLKDLGIDGDNIRMDLGEVVWKGMV